MRGRRPAPLAAGSWGEALCVAEVPARPCPTGHTRVSVRSGPPCVSGDRVTGDGWAVEAGAKRCGC